MLKILNAPDPVLSQKAKQIPKIDNKTLKIIEGMKKTLDGTTDPKGVGLAAPQVGKSLQLFIVKPAPKSPIQVFINPLIIKKTETGHLTIDSGRGQQLNASSSKNSKNIKLEGCLSLLNIWGEVRREPEITLQYQQVANNRQLITKTRIFSDFMATIIQHETDHLNGILFPKRVLEQKGTLYKSSKNEKGEDEFEEIEV